MCKITKCLDQFPILKIFLIMCKTAVGFEAAVAKRDQVVVLLNAACDDLLAGLEAAYLHGLREADGHQVIPAALRILGKFNSSCVALFHADRFHSFLDVRSRSCTIWQLLFALKRKF